MNLRFHFFVSGVNPGNKRGERGECKISLCYPKGLGAFSTVISRDGWFNLVGVSCL